MSTDLKHYDTSRSLNEKEEQFLEKQTINFDTSLSVWFRSSIIVI